MLCIIVESKDDVEAFKDFVPDTSQSSLPKPSESVTPPISSPVLSSSPKISSTVSAAISAITSRIKATPYAKKVASETRIDLSVFIINIIKKFNSVLSIFLYKFLIIKINL